MNEISVYVVTGFLGSGKTTFCNHLLNLPDWKKVNLLFLQFESGEEEFSCVHANCRVKCFPKRMLEQQLEEVIRQVAQAIETHPVDEIWVEWNSGTISTESFAFSATNSKKTFFAENHISCRCRQH